MKNLVLDENIILLAAKAEDISGNRDYTCFSVLYQVLQECDYVLYCSTELIRKYEHKLDDLEKIDKSAKFTSTIIKHLQRNKKIRIRTYLPDLVQEEDIPKNDKFLIRLAAITESVVITTDSRLRDKLILKGLTQKY
jgi:hypothetical protein